MIGAGDRVMVCLSGGKDSYTLLDILLSLQRGAPVDFSLVAVNLDQKQPGFPRRCAAGVSAPTGRAVSHHRTGHLQRRQTGGARGPDDVRPVLTAAAWRPVPLRGEHGITRIALGHHRDDILETFFLNLFFGGRLKAMAPKLLSDDARHIVIRPLAYVSEAQIARYATAREFPIIPCTLCGSQQTCSACRSRACWPPGSARVPGRVQNIFAALRNVAPSHLADTALHDFAGLDALRRTTPMTLEEEDALVAAP